MESDFTLMKWKTALSKWLTIAFAGILSFALTGCDDKNEEQTYLYTIGIAGYTYSGPSLLGPMEYLRSLNIPDEFTVTGTGLQEADARAVTRFNTEMTRIDATRLETIEGTYSFRYELYSVGSQKTIASKSFSSQP